MGNRRMDKNFLKRVKENLTERQKNVLNYIQPVVKLLCLCYNTGDEK